MAPRAIRAVCEAVKFLSPATTLPPEEGPFRGRGDFRLGLLIFMFFSFMLRGLDHSFVAAPQTPLFYNLFSVVSTDEHVLSFPNQRRCSLCGVLWSSLGSCSQINFVQQFVVRVPVDLVLRYLHSFNAPYNGCLRVPFAILYTFLLNFRSLVRLTGGLLLHCGQQFVMSLFQRQNLLSALRIYPSEKARLALSLPTRRRYSSRKIMSYRVSHYARWVMLRERLRFFSGSVRLFPFAEMPDTPSLIPDNKKLPDVLKSRLSIAPSLGFHPFFFSRWPPYQPIEPTKHAGGLFFLSGAKGASIPSAIVARTGAPAFNGKNSFFPAPPATFISTPSQRGGEFRHPKRFPGRICSHKGNDCGFASCVGRRAVLPPTVLTGV